MTALLVVLAVFVVLLFSEYLARTTRIHAELTRKFVHMTVGSFVAFWPFFLSWHQIELLSLAFLVVVLFSIKFNVFHSIHTSPSRKTGEVLFAVVIGLLAFFSGGQWIFTAAMLHLSLGDGAAAIIGLIFGDNNRYKVFGKTKSVAGTVAFFIVSFGVMSLYVAAGPGGANLTNLLMVPAIATAAENLAVNGTDNLIMPLLVALILGSSA